MQALAALGALFVLLVIARAAASVTRALRGSQGINFSKDGARLIDTRSAAAGRANRRISDKDQLAFATTESRVLVSHDVHFPNPRQVPHLATDQHAGVVAIRRTASVGDQARFLRYIAETETLDTMRSQIHYYVPVPHGSFPAD